MVDKITSPSLVNSTIERKPVTPDKAKSAESLRQGFQTLSNTLRATEILVRDQKPSRTESRQQENPKKADSVKIDPDSKIDSLNNAVRYSREALNSLEQVTAGGLSSQKVASLLTEDDESSDRIPLRPDMERTPVGELARDLDALKSNLRDLFIALKEKADQSNITISNREASNPRVEDLKLVTEMARSTSSEIKFNPDNAIEAHSGLDFNSVSRLLRESDEKIL